MKTLVRLLCTIATLVFCSPALATDSSPEPPSLVSAESPAADQILLISSRGYPTVIGRTFNFECTLARELDSCGRRLNHIPLHSPLPTMETWLFVHGNQIPACDAVRRGVRVYRRLRGCKSSEEPVRFIIWSWPSQRETGRLRDAKLKAVRTDVESFLLGSLLCRIAGDSPISIIGYSFGSRIASGALHLASGGKLCGFRLPETLDAPQPFRLVHIAAAVEDDGYHARCGRYRHALDHVASLSLLNNSRDPALNFFWIINKSRPTAMGDTGIVAAPPHCCIQQTNWAKAIGRDHSLWEYIDRPAALRRIMDGIQH